MTLPRAYSHPLDLLRRVVAAGRADRFALRDVASRDLGRMQVALDCLLDLGCAERVTTGCGRWHYRLTAWGLRSHAEGRIVAAPDVSGRPYHGVAGGAEVENRRVMRKGGGEG